MPMAGLNPKTGKRYANQTVKASANLKKGKMYIKFLNVQGEMEGPFEIDVDPVKLLGEYQVVLL